MSKFALQLIEENKRTKETFLDLGNCGLNNYLPKELIECIWLEILNLGVFQMKGEEVVLKNRGKRNQFNGNGLAILSNLPQLQSLYLNSSQIRDISFLSNLTHLKSLRLSDNQIQDISFLSGLTQLQSLDISDNQIQDISFLSNLTQLQFLDIRFNNIRNYNFLSYLTQLQSLYLSDNQIQDISFLSNLTQLQSLYFNSKNISNYNFLSNLTQLQSLDLSASFIWDYSFLSNLPQLHSLNLNSNQIEDYSFLSNLTQLRSLYLNSSQIKDINFLSNLVQLQSLDLSFNRVKDISFLSNLTQLQSLYLNSNQIQDISFLSNLTQLQSLYLNSNQIQDISFLSNLSQLQSLDLRSNQIKDISFLSNLTQLEYLNLSSNQIQDISFLSNLTQLQSLYLSANKIQKINFLSNLTQLKSLYLNSNQIQDISSLLNLTQLQYLYLNDNQIQDISSLLNLTQLQYLYLNDNQIQDINVLINLSNLYYLSLNSNPAQFEYNLNLIPFENHWDIIRNIIDREKETNETYNIIPPVKIILLGNHASGKSSFLHFLLKSNLKYKGKSTHILNIKSYPQKSRMPKAIFFDFGGQDYYHGIYRIFLSIGSIYLLFWNKKNNNNRRTPDSMKIPIQNFNLKYWLAKKNYYFQESEDPIFVIQTHAQENETPDYSEIPFNKSVENIFYISLHNDFNPLQNQRALEYLKSSIDDLIQRIQKRREQKEPKWYVNFIKYILSTDTKDSVTLTNLVQKYTPQDKNSEDTLSSLKAELQQLHNQGLVLYYQNINQNKVWLNPSQLVKHIHENILRKELLTHYNGIIPKEEFNKIDKEILLLLKEQKVIFEHESKEYIIPNYLCLTSSTQSEYSLFTFGLNNPNFILKFKNFLPIGLINQLICFFGKQPDSKKFWRDQLLFIFEGKYKILINLNFELLELKVFISSSDNNTKEIDRLIHYLFYVIMTMYCDFKPLEYVDVQNQNSELKETEDLKIKREQYNEIFNGKRFLPSDLYISRDGVYWIQYTDLIEKNASEKKIVSYQLDSFNVINGKPKNVSIKPFEMFTVKRFSSMKKVFISYSKFDEDYKNELQEHMISLKRENFVEVFDDRQLELGDKWDDILKQKIDECDYFICLVSRSFLNVSYIYEEEMPRAFKEGKKIIPIIIKPCDWINTPIKNFDDTDENPPKLGHINAHNKGKVIGLNDGYINQRGQAELRAFTEIERDAMWLDVVNKIRALIKKDS